VPEGVLQVLLGVLHTVPGPGQSLRDKSDKGKGREREAQTWIQLVGQPCLRPGLAGVAGDLGNIALPTTGVWLQRRFIWLQCPGHHLLLGNTPPDG